MNATITVFTSRKPQRLAKLWRREGTTHIKEPAGQMCEGTAEHALIASPDELAKLIESMDSGQALGAGKANISLARIVTERLLADHPEALSRTREHFDWSDSNGWMVLDYDPRRGQQALQIDQLRQTLIEAWPALAQAPMCGYYSGSSWIRDNRTSNWVTEGRGIHLWVLVDTATQIPTAGERLAARLWLAGQGFFAVSTSGALLERCLIDTAVWQPERLIFSAQPVCLDGLSCERPAVQVWNQGAAALELSSTLPALTEQEQKQLLAAKVKVKNNPALEQEAASARNAWVDQRMQHLTTQATDAERAYARADLLRAVKDSVLVGDFELTTQTGSKILVADLFSDPEQWNGVRFCDPLEPEREDGDTRIAFARTLGVREPFIYSHAHGGVRYALGTRREELLLLAGEDGVNSARIARRLAETNLVYRRGAKLLTIHGESYCTLSLPTVKGLIEGLFRLIRHNAGSGNTRVVSCPDDLANRVLATLPQYSKTLRAIVTYPVMRPDGLVLTTPGYDAESGLYFAPASGEGRSIPELDGLADLKSALGRVWAPFRDVCFKTDADRCMFLALLFTAMGRPALTTAPGFLIRAHMPGTGKTLLCKAVLAVVGASPTVHLADTTQPEEFAKRIGTAVRGGSPVIVFDNLTGVIQNGELNALLTSDRVAIRRLGSNDPEPEVETRSLWILNGNNVAPSADMNRRLLPISLDAGVEHPELRRFDSCPEAEITQRRDAYQDDLLAIMRMYHHAGAPLIEPGSGLGSYTEWDCTIRQLLLWLGRQDIMPFQSVDVATVVKANGADDPERIAYTAFLEAARALHGDKAFTLRHLTSANDGMFAVGTPEQLSAARALAETAAELAPARQGQDYNANALGLLLSRKLGQICGTLKLERGNKSKAGMRYRVVDAC